MKRIAFILICLSLLTTQIYSQIENMTEVGRWPGGFCFVVSTDSNFVYRGNGGYFEIVDVQNPNLPQMIGRVPTPGLVRGIAVKDNYAYIADWYKGLRIINISNPNEPYEVGFYDTKVGQYDLFGKAIDLAVNDNFVYLADDGGGVHSGIYVIDVSDPKNPQEVSVHVTEGYCFGLSYDGEYLYAASGNSGLVIIDVSDPANLHEVGSYYTQDCYAYDVDVSGNYAYVAAYQSGLRVIDISNPENPQEIGYYDTPYKTEQIDVQGNYAYINDRQISESQESGVRIIDISEPSDPQEVSFHITEVIPYGVSATDTLLYIANRSSGMRVIEVTDPANPKEIGFLESPARTLTIEIRDDNAFVANGYSGLQILDLSNITTPVDIGHFDTPGRAVDIALRGDYAFIADSYNEKLVQTGLRIIDISDLNSPQEVAFALYGATVSSISVKDKYLYAASNGIQIFDISDPLNPQWVGSNENIFGKMIFSGDYAYTVFSEGFGGGLNVVDVTDPVNPVKVGYIDLPGWGRKVAIRGDYAYVANWSDGLRVIDISDPTNPIEVGYWNRDYNLVWADGVALHNNFAYVADYEKGVHVIDIQDPVNPIEVGYYELWIEANSIVMKEDNILVGAGIWGMLILNNDLISGASRIKRHGIKPFDKLLVYPNPIHNIAQIDYNLCLGQHVKIKIYDSSGKIVKELIDQKQSPGLHHMKWDAKDFLNGIYFIKIQAGNYSQTKKIFLQR